MMRDFLGYAEFAVFWDRFQPETPFGREEKERLRVLDEAGALTQLWDETDVLLDFLRELEQDEVRLARILHHLKRLPRFLDEPRPVYDEVELFQFKKFLHNYKSIGELLNATVRATFAFDFISDAFERLLDRGRQSAESFYVADDYSAELAQVRAELRQLGEAGLKLRAERLAAVQARWGLEFGSREFLLVPRERLGEASELLLVEPYDEALCAVRPLRSAEELVLAERRVQLLAKERSCEEDVLEYLSHAARQELAQLLEYREAAKRFDLALARARLAKEQGLVRPVLTEGSIRIRQGRFLPCEEACRALAMCYTPLDATLDASVSVVFGSNMGGKTMVLKTVAFLQLCAQTGLFVPADSFETRVFRSFHYLGEGSAREPIQGLSGFGFEIRSLTQVWNDLDTPTLALFDEFARTTSSHEAEAILSAVTEALVGRPRVVALFSTHFRGVKRLDRAHYLRMQGLDRRSLDFQEAEGRSLDERIRLINSHMDHRLVADEGTQDGSDAIAVAALLGLDPAVAERARLHFQTSNRAQE